MDVASPVMKALIRAAALMAGWLVVFLIGRSTADDAGGANIGLGLAWFAVLIVVGFGWGYRDGRTTELGAVALTWVMVGVVVGVAGSLLSGLGGSGFDARVWLGDLLVVAPFAVAMVAVPAVLGALLAGTARSAGRGRV